MATEIKFGTDGWRAIIAQDYTVEGVLRVSEGAAKWMKSRDLSRVVIGYDCRFGGLLFSTAAATVFCHYQIEVVMDRNFVTTPMVSLGVLKHRAGLGVVITASHNPPSYNGFKLKAKYGGPSVPDDVREVEALIPGTSTVQLKTLEELELTSFLTYSDLESLYVSEVMENFDMSSLESMQLSMAYDAMFGAGQNVIKRLFPQALHLHCEYNPSFNGTSPEPIDRNLKQLSEAIRTNEEITF
jgi:phosphomannomutase